MLISLTLRNVLMSLRNAAHIQRTQLRMDLSSKIGKKERIPNAEGAAAAAAAAERRAARLAEKQARKQNSAQNTNQNNVHNAAQNMAALNVDAASELGGRVKVPKGTRDTHPEQMAIREKAFAKIRSIFKRHGAVEIETPVFELKETLTGKYGEDSKLIYDLADQGGEILALRYDLTVPFARYVATHGIDSIKRFHIGRVYRRDNPVMSKGRFREFYQCDFDIAGVHPPMVPDSVVLSVVHELLTQLDIGGFVIKLNHRKLLDAIMIIANVPEASLRPICSAIDKLDKESWEEVKKEMVEVKHLPSQNADIIGKYVVGRAGFGPTLLAELRDDPVLSKNAKAQEAFSDLDLLFRYLKRFGCLDRVSFDLSLARGLDYYTGVIYEAVLTDTDRVGSIAAGGRYDTLVGMFSTKDVPAVGVSLGIERLLTILEEMEMKRGNARKISTQVLVASQGAEMLEHRMEITQELWAAGIDADFMYHEKPRTTKQIEYALHNSIPVMIWIGDKELNENAVQVKDMKSAVQVQVSRSDMISHVKSLLASYN